MMSRHWCRESIQDVEIKQCWICAVLWWPFWKWRPVEIFRCQESIRCVIKLLFSKTVTNMTFYNEIKKSCLKIINENLLYEKMNKNLYEKIMETGRYFSMSGINSGRWNQTMLNLCGIVVAILNMVTGRNFSMSGHHYLPTNQILMISDNVEDFIIVRL
jgi:hypothetical protein